MASRVIVLIFSLCAFGVHAQQNNKRFTNIIDSLTSESTQIIFSNDLIDVDDLVINRDIRNIQELSIYLNDNDLILSEVLEGVYIIKPKATDDLDKKVQRIVVGRVLDSETGKPIKNSEVINTIDNSIYKRRGIISYFIPGDTGDEFNLKISADGYEDQFDLINIENDLVSVKEYYLVKLPKTLETLYVTTSLYDFAKLDFANRKSLNREDLLTTPQAGNDAVRAVNKLPGITSNGISARTHVRGGRQDESQVVLNGLSLKNPYHFKDFFGVFSSINLSYVDELSLYAGVFPAKFGSYISSVMDIQSTEPKDEFFLDLSFGVLNSHATFGDSIGQSHYLISYRSGGDLFRTGLIDVETGDPSYDDLFTQFEYQFENGTSVSANVLHTKDNINLNLEEEDETARAKYIDNNYWVEIDKPISKDTALKTVISYQTFHTDRSGELFDDELQGSILERKTTNHYGLNSELNHRYSENLSFSYGFNFKHEKTNIQFESILSGTDFISAILNPDQIDRSRNHIFTNSGNSAAVFGNVRYQFNQDLIADFGLRVDYQDWISKSQISPRMNLSYFFDDTLTFRLGLGQHFQNQSIDGVLLEDEELAYFRTESANIGIFEVQRELGLRHDLRAEFYYKDYNDVQPYYENLFIDLHLHPELFSDRVRINPDSAFSKGVDITFSGFYDHFNWSASYSFSEVKDVINSREVLRDWDQQNAVKLNMGWTWDKFQFNSLLFYHSGWPATSVREIGEEIVIGNRNSIRNKDYLNLDLRLAYQTTSWGKKTTYWLQLTNALNRENQCCFEYEFDTNVDGDREFVREQKQWLPLIPSFGFDISF